MKKGKRKSTLKDKPEALNSNNQIITKFKILNK